VGNRVSLLEAEGLCGKKNTPVGSTEDLCAWKQSDMWKTEIFLWKAEYICEKQRIRVGGKSSFMGSRKLYLSEAEDLWDVEDLNDKQRISHLCGEQSAILGRRISFWEAEYLCGEQRIYMVFKVSM
jgi:hypothetical protein